MWNYCMEDGLALKYENEEKSLEKVPKIVAVVPKKSKIGLPKMCCEMDSRNGLLKPDGNVDNIQSEKNVGKYYQKKSGKSTKKPKNWSEF